MRVDDRLPPLARVPQELVDNIIDHLQGDKSALFSCSLTCREWLPWSRHLLFSQTVVYTLGGVETRGQPHPDQWTAHRAQEFLSFLTMSPHIAKTIKQLKIRGKLRDDSNYKGSLRFSLLISILSRLPNLDSLELSALVLPLLGQNEDAKFAQGVIRSLTPQHLNRLTLTELGGLDIVSDVLHLFSSISHFAVDHLVTAPWWISYKDTAEYCQKSAEFRPAHHLKLVSWTISNSLPSLSLFELLRVSPSPRSLIYLDIDCRSIPTMHAMIAFMREAGSDPPLRHCRIALTFNIHDLDPIPISDSLPSPDFSSCTNLHSFHLGLWLSPSPTPSITRFINIGTDILRTLPSIPTIHTLHFTLQIRSRRSWDLKEVLESHVHWTIVERTIERLEGLSDFYVDAFTEGRGDTLDGDTGLVAVITQKLGGVGKALKFGQGPNFSV